MLLLGHPLVATVTGSVSAQLSSPSGMALAVGRRRSKNIYHLFSGSIDSRTEGCEHREAVLVQHGKVVQSNSSCGILNGIPLFHAVALLPSVEV